MNKKEILIIVGIVLVVAVVAIIATASITGNVISIQKPSAEVSKCVADCQKNCTKLSLRDRSSCRVKCTASCPRYNEIYTRTEIDSFITEIDDTFTRIYTMIDGGNSSNGGYYDVYTKSEVDGLIKGSCEFVNYKSVSSVGIPFAGMSMMDACQNTWGYLPKVIVVHEQKELYNHVDCSPSYSVFSSTGELWSAYRTELANVKLGEEITNQCFNSSFKDGTSNAGFSSSTYQVYSGVLCCKP